GNAEPVGEDHGTFYAALVAGKAQGNAVFGGKRVYRRSTDAERTLLAGRRIGVEGAGARENVAIGLEEGAGEEAAECRQALEALGLIGSVGDLHGGHLFGEVGGLDVKDPFAHDESGMLSSW